MEKQDILAKVNEIFIDILGDKNILLNKATTADDVEGWDSLTHIQIVVFIEKKFRIRFTSREIQGWQNIGELCDSIILKNK